MVQPFPCSLNITNCNLRLSFPPSLTHSLLIVSFFSFPELTSLFHSSSHHPNSLTHSLFFVSLLPISFHPASPPPYPDPLFPASPLPCPAPALPCLASHPPTHQTNLPHPFLLHPTLPHLHPDLSVSHSFKVQWPKMDSTQAELLRNAPRVIEERFTSYKKDWLQGTTEEDKNTRRRSNIVTLNERSAHAGLETGVS